jgi:uncharacterized protein (TIGR02594 family)
MTFAQWLQGRLVAHGASINVDGVIGPSTKTAISDFQKRVGIKVTGVADNPTVEALRTDPKTHKHASVPPAELMPPWMAEMHRRMGLHEVRDKASLISWLKIGKYLGDPSRLPWCGDALETAMVKTLPNEPVPNNPFWAQAWKDFGVGVGAPKVGSIGVIRWNASSGHVGIVAAYDAKGQRVLLLGGNQSDKISLSWFKLSAFIAFRWPKSYPLRAYPALTADGSSTGSLAGTR